jgi:amino acid transporter
MSATTSPTGPGGGSRLARAAQVIIVSSVMFTFISYWRTAAVVLCDLASTAYYIGGIVEQAIGKAAPWFILAVMLFSYAVRSVYIESCSLFVRGGVYRVVKEAMGGFLAKLSVSALMFDYVLTGPISGVSAGTYIVGLGIDTLGYLFPAYAIQDEAAKKFIVRWGAVVIACAITLYFFRQNLLGIHESSDKALKIMILTTVMAVVLIGWCCATLAVKGPVNRVPLAPNFQTKMNYDKGAEEDPLGFLSHTRLAHRLRVEEVAGVEDGRLLYFDRNGEKHDLAVAPDAQITFDGRPIPRDSLADVPRGAAVELALDAQGAAVQIVATSKSGINWFTLVGLIGLLIAFGHSILAMSGEETLAQVYREVESPKLTNFKKAAFIVFVYSVLLTTVISFLAVLLIPDNVRMPDYSGNLISGLAMHVTGPWGARLLLQAFVVVVGFLILAGAVNTAIIGSNGVLNRVAEDGVMPDWFLKPHPRYGTSHRVLYLILILQLAVILISRGNIIALGEAYAFGVVWSFVFKALAMVVLRFRDRSPREFKVPLNVRIKGVELPIGLSLIFLVLLATALMNLLTKEVATISGGAFTLGFLTVFMISEHFHQQRARGGKHEHLEQFNQRSAEAVNLATLDLRKSYRKLVAIRSPQNLQMLDKALEDTDPATTDVVVMTAKVSPPGSGSAVEPALDDYDQHLMTAVVQHAEKAGKQVKPLIVPTNNPLYAIIRAAKDLQAQELVVGASNKYTADEQLDQIAFYWFSLHEGQPAPLTVRLLGRERDVHLDLAGGNRIPRISERQARTVADLRAAGVGVDRVLLAHDNSSESSDLFQAMLTMLDPQVALGVVRVPPQGLGPDNGFLAHDVEQARQLGRSVAIHALSDDELVPEIVRVAAEGKYDLIVASTTSEGASGRARLLNIGALLRAAPCRVFLSAPPAIPQQPEM